MLYSFSKQNQSQSLQDTCANFILSQFMPTDPEQSDDRKLWLLGSIKDQLSIILSNHNDEAVKKAFNQIKHVLGLLFYTADYRETICLNFIEKQCKKYYPPHQALYITKGLAIQGAPKEIAQTILNLMNNPAHVLLKDSKSQFSKTFAENYGGEKVLELNDKAETTSLKLK